MTESSESNFREVSIVKKTTTMSSEEYFSIQLKSPDESVDSLLRKAILAANSAHPQTKPSVLGGP